MIRLIKPYISYDEVERYYRDIFNSGILTKGIYTKEFPNLLKEYTGAKYAYLTTSATTALTMCLKVLNVGVGDEVIVSDFSFPASANVIEDVGATPVFADVNTDTFNMDFCELESKITPKTKAVIFVDALGNPSGLNTIKEICKTRDIPMIEDAACSIGSSINNIKTGNIADLTCFSFHPRKLLTTGEGGAILTNNKKYADMLEVKLNHGASVVDGTLDFVEFGYNYRLTDQQCIMGIIQLKKLDDIVKKRIEVQKIYIKGLSNLGFEEQKKDPDVIHNNQSIVFKVRDDINVKLLIDELKIKEIESTIGTYSLSNCTYYRNKYNKVQKNSTYLQNHTITLPCYDNVDVDFIIQQIKEILLK